MKVLTAGSNPPPVPATETEHDMAHGDGSVVIPAGAGQAVGRGSAPPAPAKGAPEVGQFLFLFPAVFAVPAVAFSWPCTYAPMPTRAVSASTSSRIIWR